MSDRAAKYREMADLGVPGDVLALIRERDDALDRAEQAESAVERARAVATIWRDDYLRFMDEKRTDTQWAIGTHPLNMVLAALDGETDPVQLGVSPHRLRAALTDTGDVEP